MRVGKGDDGFSVVDIVIHPDVVKGQRLDIFRVGRGVVEDDQEGFLGEFQVTIQDGRE
jgi:hypothetical protein